MSTGVIGILGGMGPDATAWFFSRLVKLDHAATDQEHLHVIVESDPSIPDRTAWLLGKGTDPLPVMLASARRLMAAGADIAGIPCMTAHAFLPALRQHTRLRFLSAFEELARTLETQYSSIRTIGILGTMGTRHTALFEHHLPAFEVLWPDWHLHESLVMEAIYGKEGIKAGNTGEGPRAALRTAALHLIAQGAQCIIAGCTEVPLVLTQSDIEVPLIEPMEGLALALIREARKGARP